MSDPLFIGRHPRYAGPVPLSEGGFRGKRLRFELPQWAAPEPLALFAALWLISAGLVIGGLAAVVALSRWFAA